MSHILKRFLAGEPSTPDRLLATSASQPQPKQEGDPLSTKSSRELAQESTRRPPVPASLPLYSSDSDDGTSSEYSESILSRGPSSNSSANDTRSIPGSFHLGNEDVTLFEGSPGRLRCDFVRCPASFPLISREVWYLHSLSHFGSQEPPKSCLCIFCHTIFSNEDPWQCWDARMTHIGDHFVNGWTIEQTRPDFTLIAYLGRRNLISKEDWCDMFHYTERPIIDGLRHERWLPKETFEIQRRRFRQWNEVVFDQQREYRGQKKLASIKTSRRKRERISQPQNKDTSKVTIHYLPQTKRDLPTRYPIPEQQIYNDRFGKLPADKVGLNSLAVQEVLEIANSADEADRFLQDPKSLLASLDDSDSESSDSIQDTSCGISNTTRGNILDIKQSESSHSPDYDPDDDLISPAQYRLRLKILKDTIFKNSVAALVESDPQSLLRVKTPLGQETSFFALDHLEMLKRIKQNIDTLQESGFCQGKISFLMTDSKRPNVALLVGIPIEKFRDLVSRHSGNDFCEVPGADETGRPISLGPDIPKRERNGPIIHQNDTARERKRLTGNFSMHEGTADSSPTFATAVRSISTSASLTSYFASSSFSKNDSISHVPAVSRDKYGNFELFSRRETLLRVPDPPLDPEKFGQDSLAYGIFKISRGRVDVFNHRKRREGDAEPSASESLHKGGIKRGWPSLPTAISKNEKGYSVPGLSGSDSSWNLLASDCMNILETLGMETDFVDASHTVYTTLRILDFIVLSYSRAHLSPLENNPNSTGSLRSYLKISGRQGHAAMNTNQTQKGAIVLACRTLKCLSGFLDSQPVWVFHTRQIDTKEKQPLFLSAFPEDFADIWGPMWKMTDPCNSNRVRRYDLEHGSIIPVSSTREAGHLIVDQQSDEDLCHWISHNELQDPRNTETAATVSKPRLLIGARKKMKLEENRDCHCEASCVTRELRDACRLRPVGTNASRRRLEAEIVGGTIGGGITGVQAAYSMITKIEAGRTFKESLIERWSHGQQRRNPHVLLKHGAVEMSYCTKNSRRIRVVDLLGTRTMLKLLDAIDPITDQECNAAVKEVLNNNPARLIDLYLDKPEWRAEIAALVSACLETLCDTGIKDELLEPISLFWMHKNEEYIAGLPRSTHGWSGFIQDSLTSCAFVILEEKCLVMEVGRSCQHTSRSGKTKARKECDPVFESALVVNKHLEQPTGLKLVKKGNAKDLTCWDVSKLERGSVFQMGDSGGLEVIMPLSRTRLLVKWFPKNPVKAGFQAFLSRIVERDPEMHHIEYDGEAIAGDPLPISVFIVA